MATATTPNPWAFCPHELMARESAPTCAFCDCVEVAQAGDFCSPECAELAAEDRKDAEEVRS